MLPHGLLGVPPFLLIIPFAVVAGLLVFLTGAEREGLERRRVIVLQLALIAAALAGARGFSWLVDSAWSGPGAAALGWRQSGGVFGFMLALPLLRPLLLPEVSLARYADLLAPTIPAALGLLRIQCFLLGCCTGPVCDELFCLSYAPGSVVWRSHVDAGLVQPTGASLPVFPLHLVMLATSLGIAVWLWRYAPRRRFDGEVFLLFLIVHEGLKAVLELFREPPLVALQLSSLIPALAGLAAWWLLRRRRVGLAPR